MLQIVSHFACLQTNAYIVAPYYVAEKAQELVLEGNLILYNEVLLLKEKQLDTSFKNYSVLQISEMLGVGKTKTRELLDSGVLPVTKVGRQYFTSPAAIDEFLKKNIGNVIFF